MAGDERAGEMMEEAAGLGEAVANLAWSEAETLRAIVGMKPDPGGTLGKALEAAGPGGMLDKVLEAAGLGETLVGLPGVRGEIEGRSEEIVEP